MNSVELIGRLVYEPEVKKIESGSSVLSLRIAVPRNDKAKTTDFINCQAWDKTADFIGKYFHKGDPIDITGRLQNKSYEKQDGTKVAETFVYIKEAAFVPGKTNNQSEPEDYSI